MLLVVCCLSGRGNTDANSSLSAAPRSLDPMLPAQKSSAAAHSAEMVNLAWGSKKVFAVSYYLRVGLAPQFSSWLALFCQTGCLVLQPTLNHASSSDAGSETPGTISLVLTFVPRFFQDSPNDGLHQEEPGGDPSPRGARSQPAAEE